MKLDPWDRVVNTLRAIWDLSEHLDELLETGEDAAFDAQMQERDELMRELHGHLGVAIEQGVLKAGAPRRSSADILGAQPGANDPWQDVVDALWILESPFKQLDESEDEAELGALRARRDRELVELHGHLSVAIEQGSL